MRLTSEQRKWVAAAEGVAAKIAGRSRAFDEAATFPHENFELLRQAGLLRLAVPKACGGEGPETGNAHLGCYLVAEAISRACTTTGWDLIIHYHQCGAVARLGNEDQRRRILGDVARNGALMGSLGSEINIQQQTASKNTETRLIFQADMVPTEGGFLASAKKGFCSNGPVADYLLYWSVAPGTKSGGEGLTLSVVTKDSPGLTFVEGGWDEVMGLRGTISWGATMENVFIPWKNVLGEPGDFVQKDPYTLELSQSFQLLGAAQGALDFVLSTLRDRPFLRKEEGLMVLVGELSAAVQASRGSCFYANALWEEEKFSDAALASLMAHHTARETALLVVGKAFDIVGTRGLLKTNPLDLIWRDVRAASLHTRGSQLLKLVADAEVDEVYAPKQKYGAKLERPTTWRDLGLGETRVVEAA